ncbi:MAG TPA: M50 family metallopeptidase [Anaeromyxobacter sp.]|nr:M50 family metallopeptidase [Anaeromyxobacter sp.]
MTTALAIVAAVLAVSLLIVIHEAGHFLAARRFGMGVERFSIGFGPVLLAFRRGETEFAVSALPLGGYVKISGMAPGEAKENADPKLFANQPAWRRFLVILAGPAMNYAAAILVAWGLLATLGLRALDPAPRVGALQPGMPAEAAGLKPGDRIAAVDGKPIATWAELVAELQRRPARPAVLDVVRGEGERAERISVPITPRDEGGVGRVGVRQHTILLRTGPGQALVQAFRGTNENAAAQLRAFGSLFQRKQRVEGPIGIARELVQGARDGAEPFLGTVWTISVVLAILNLLPFPALDGGRLVFLGYEIVTRRRVNERVEHVFHMIGFFVLVGLILAVTVFGDLPRLLGR